MRRFEYVGGTSSKFWTGDLEGSTFVVVYGRIGTAGQRKDKAFPTEEAARRELEKKIAEKLREGYTEVGGTAQQAAPAASPPPPLAKPKKPVLPPRVEASKAAKAEHIQAAAGALSALEKLLGGRSFHVGRAARRARRALESIAGHDPGGKGPLSGALCSLMGRVVATTGPRLSPRLALALLSELDVAAFSRALLLWQQASHPPAAVTALLRQVEQLADPEVALRVGLLLTDRPEHGGGPEAGWQRRWRALAPHLEGHLVYQGSTLKDYLHQLVQGHGGDDHVARRAAQMHQARQAR